MKSARNKKNYRFMDQLLGLSAGGFRRSGLGRSSLIGGIVLCIILGWHQSSHAQTPVVKVDILGVWKYIGFMYEGNFYRPPNPDLNLTFTFNLNGENRLFWEDKGEPGFCERFAKYHVDEISNLYQEITWVNPKNKAECSKDSDMQFGRKTTNHIEIKGNQLWLYLVLNGKDFIYMLEKQ